MKTIIAILATSATLSAHAEGDARILFYQMTPTVLVSITNDFCSLEEHRRTHPWAAYQFYVGADERANSGNTPFAVGCYGPKDMKLNDIVFVWDGHVSFELPANAFLINQQFYHQEVPKIPEIPNDGKRQDI